MAYTYAYLIKPVSDLHSTDLVEEAQELLAEGLELIAASVTIYSKGEVASA